MPSLCRIGTSGLILASSMIALAIGVAAAQTGQPFKSNTVRAAREAYIAALDKARSDCSAKAVAAQKKYLAALDLAVRQATKESDLDEANRLKAESDLVAAEAFEDELRSLFGTWRVRWGADSYTNYTFHKDGTVYRELQNEARNGVLRRDGTDLLLEFTDKSRMRVIYGGNRLILEYFERPGAYQTAYPSKFGTAERVKS